MKWLGSRVDGGHNSMPAQTMSPKSPHESEAFGELEGKGCTTVPAHTTETQQSPW